MDTCSHAGRLPVDVERAAEDRAAEYGCKIVEESETGPAIFIRNPDGHRPAPLLETDRLGRAPRPGGAPT